MPSPSRHTKSHAKPHKCPHFGCNAGFQYKKGLTRHQTTHEGRQYFCDRCGSGFTRLDNLERHQTDFQHNALNYYPPPEKSTTGIWPDYTVRLAQSPYIKRFLQYFGRSDQPAVLNITRSRDFQLRSNPLL
jgi:uncharacterized Zn-finger protein